jgi:uncharacterized protein (TIGR02265 family)
MSMDAARSSGRYVFAVAVEALFLDAVQGKLDDSAKRRLREAGIDLGETLLAVYPADVFHRGVQIAAEAVYPDLPADQAQFRLGQVHLEGFTRTYPGRMMLALARQLAPRTILDYTATFIRLGNNFTESRSRMMGDGQVELWLNDVFGAPHWYGGIVHRGLTLSNVKGVEVRLTGGGQDATYLVSWTGR